MLKQKENHSKRYNYDKKSLKGYSHFPREYYGSVRTFYRSNQKFIYGDFAIENTWYLRSDKQYYTLQQKIINIPYGEEDRILEKSYREMQPYGNPDHHARKYSRSWNINRFLH
jgi:hypothetical protein